jgi:CRISPR system Cascade subunit CasB
MSQNIPKNPDEELIRHLIAACRDRGAAAELRRYWSPATRHYAFAVLGRIGVTNPRSSDAFTAALYALNPRHAAGGLRVGQALQKFGGSKDSDSFDAHVRRLLASDDLEDVADQLQRLFVRLDREGISLDYIRLLWDLRNWPKKSEEVKTRWGQDYWMKSKEQEATESLAS